ncbi:MAG: LysM peptidoglycan-binding domain-containing protein [Moheibacter sp.]
MATLEDVFEQFESDINKALFISRESLKFRMSASNSTIDLSKIEISLKNHLTNTLKVNTQDVLSKYLEDCVNQGHFGTDPPTHYRVKAGDNLSKIAKNHGITVKEIKRLNNILGNGDLIYPGQLLNVTPESDFSKHYGGYSANRKNSKGVLVQPKQTADLILNFLDNKGPENSLITGGGALQQIMSMPEVNNKLRQLIKELMKNGLDSGEVHYDWFEGGHIYQDYQASMRMAASVTDFFS